MGDLSTTVLSTKGQLVLPKAIRDQQKLRPGTKFTVEVTKDGYLFRPVPLFPRTELKDVAGMLAYKGPPISIEDMDIAVLAEAKRSYDRG